VFRLLGLHSRFFGWCGCCAALRKAGNSVEIFRAGRRLYGNVPPDDLFFIVFDQLEAFEDRRWRWRAPIKKEDDC
jgi:hypothetical protein